MTRAPFRSCLVIDSLKAMKYIATFAVLLCLVGMLPAYAQNGLPFMNAGPDSAFAQIDFAQIYLNTTNKELQKNAGIQAQRRELVTSGAVSALDLEAPGKALDEYNRAATLMKEQNAKQAITHLQKALAAYPKFVLAHNTLGLAYLDQQDGRAKSEFEAAAKLDDRFPGSFLNLGLLALSAQDFASADSNLQKAASLRPKDPKILAALAFAQNGNHEFKQTLETVEQVHALDHRGMANVHYIAASAALSLNDLNTVQRQLIVFLEEDPTSPLAPVARKNLDVLNRRLTQPVQASGTAGSRATASQPRQVQTFPNSEHLEAELNAVSSESTSADESNAEEKNTTVAGAGASAAPMRSATPAGGLFTIRTAVDETALFFAVSAHGHMVNDLELSNIHISDDAKPPKESCSSVPNRSFLCGWAC